MIWARFFGKGSPPACGIISYLSGVNPTAERQKIKTKKFQKVEKTWTKLDVQNLSKFKYLQLYQIKLWSQTGKVVPLISLANIMLKGGGITSTKTQSKEEPNAPYLLNNWHND